MSPYGVLMRWEDLFSDFEGQWNAAQEEDWRAQVAERTRGERGAVELSARVMAARGSEVFLTLLDGEMLKGELTDCTHTWLLIVDLGHRQHLVPAHAVAMVRGLDHVGRTLSEVERRLGLSHVLRVLSRDRVRVRVRTVGGEVHGVIATVQADHIDVAGDGPLRTSVPFAQIVEVVSA